MPMIENKEPELWAEDALPEYAAGCRKCELYGHRTSMIWGEGNPRGELIVILDNPGLREDKNGQPFVCGCIFRRFRSGRYLCYICLKCRPKKAYDKDTARLRCMEYIEWQLKQNNFKAAFCLGDTAVKSFFGDPEKTVKDTRGKWHDVRGIPAYTSYHPIAVRRRPNLYNIFLKDWQAVSHYLRAEKR